MGVQSNINSGISTLAYILSLGGRFKKQDVKINENEQNILDNDVKIADTQADIHASKANMTKQPFDPFDKHIEEFKSKLSSDEIAMLDAQESRKPGSTRNLVDNYIRAKMRHEKTSSMYRDRADELMSNATKEQLEDAEFMDKVNRYQSIGTSPFRTQSQFLSKAEQNNYYDTAEEIAQRAHKWNENDANRPPRMSMSEQKAKMERYNRDMANATASNRLLMDLDNKMKQESLKDERRNTLQKMSTEDLLNNLPKNTPTNSVDVKSVEDLLNNIPRGDM